MRIVPISDLHLEHQLPGTFDDIIAEIPKDIDVLVVAGDVGHHNRLSGFFDVMCDNFSDIVYVVGNHEYYHASIQDTLESIQKISDKHNNFERPMSDFGQIPEFRNWVYGENEAAQRFLNETIDAGDVVITHYLPSEQSIAPQYIGSIYNRFFVCPMDDLIEKAQPRMWIHGHTHSACYYKIKNTQIVCNPFGYELIEEKSGFCPWLTLEIEN